MYNKDTNNLNDPNNIFDTFHINEKNLNKLTLILYYQLKTYMYMYNVNKVNMVQENHTTHIATDNNKKKCSLLKQHRGWNTILILYPIANLKKIFIQCIVYVKNK